MKRFPRKLLALLLAVGLVAMPLVALAALTNQGASINGTRDGFTVPASIMSNWVNLCTDIDTADNSGNTVVNPSTITRAEQGKLSMLGSGTSVQWRIRYTTGTTITAGTIQPFGFDANSVPDKLFDDASTPSNALAFVSDASNDVQDGTYSYTASQETDANGATQVMGAIKVAATGTGAATAVLQVRVK
jgi:hypothetical protein